MIRPGSEKRFQVACKLLNTKQAPVEVVRTLSSKGARGLVFFDSGRAVSDDSDGAELWSIICCEPERIYTENSAALACFSAQRTYLPGRANIERRLPFYGGLVGMLGFEFAWAIDSVRATPAPRLTPDCWVGEYPSALVYSHREKSWWLSGDACSSGAYRLREAVYGAPKNHITEPTASTSDTMLARDYNPDFRLTISPNQYANGVESAIDAIYNGEVFEVNYTERFRARWPHGGWELYEKLRATSSGAYCAYLDAGDFQLASVSPEQFLAVEQGRVSARPIKGTRRRGETAGEDARLARELEHSPKDRAENIMIVDLMRNDLTQVCAPGSVSATEVCELYSFSGVHHLVSTVVGRLDEGVSPVGALVACFPPGSITGAPKLRAIELIAQLEHDARGPYTGTLFYASAAGGRLDSSVLIRTALLCDEQIYYGAGGAVVADSTPRDEFEEACVKAAPIVSALGVKFP